MINKNYLFALLLVPLMATGMEKITQITEKDIYVVNKCAVKNGDDVGVMYEAPLANGDLLLAIKYSSGKVTCQRLTEKSWGPFVAPRCYFSLLEKVFEERKNPR